MINKSAFYETMGVVKTDEELKSTSSCFGNSYITMTYNDIKELMEGNVLYHNDGEYTNFICLENDEVSVNNMNIPKHKQTSSMTECKPPKEKCKFCEENIYTDFDSDEFYLEVETNTWDYYYDGYEKAAIRGIKYCPYCGKELNVSDYVNI